MKKIFQKTIILFIALILVSIPMGQVTALASDNEPTSEGLFLELDKIKNEQFRYSQTISDLQNQSNGLFFDLDQARETINKNRLEIESAGQEIEKTRDQMKEKKALRDKTLRAIYINGGSEGTLLFLLSCENINQFFEQEVYLAKSHSQLKKEIGDINKIEEELSNQLEALEIKRVSLQSQIDDLENQIATNKQLLATNQGAYQELENNRKEVEKQLLDLATKQATENKRDFINWNLVDFSNIDSLTIYGAGTAHGIGMSQYGAKAMAEKGNGYEDILKYYYQGTELKKENTDTKVVRIRLSASPAGGNIIVREGKATLTKSDGTTQTLSANESTPSNLGIKLTPQEDSTRFEIDYKTNRFKTYRGIIEVVSSGGALLTINSIYIEDYLRSVISGEMSSSWPIEALKAQAIAARNYAIKNINPGKSYDLCDTPACQVYLGASYEFPSTDQAVEQTHGQLIYYGNEMITAYYFSSSGGWTENNENVWGGAPIPYLRGVASPGENSPYNSWKTDSISKNTLESYFNANPNTAVGSLKSIEILKRGVSGRVMAVKITGSSGEKLVSGGAFKTTINLGLPDGEEDYIKETLFGIK